MKDSGSDAVNKEQRKEEDPLLVDIGYEGCELDYDPVAKLYRPCTHHVSDWPDKDE